MERHPDSLAVDEIEAIERAALRGLWLATRDFATESWEYFRQSADGPKDITEDIMREMLDRMGGFQIPQRIFGNVDYRKARYVIHPDLAIRQAPLMGSKAEKSGDSATLQMSQLSMSVRQIRGGDETDVAGSLAAIQFYQGDAYLATTLFAHYHYQAAHGNDGKDRPPYNLPGITLAAIPNGRLQGSMKLASASPLPHPTLPSPGTRRGHPRRERQQSCSHGREGRGGRGLATRVSR